MSRYLLGLDLGTTNSCLAYVDTDKDKNPSLAVQLFKIPQQNGDGMREAMPTLPSFCFLENEKTHVGAYAKEQGGRTATRSVQSAKSWLCNPAAARQDRILPIECASDDLRISPVEATAAYLRHIREQWNACMSKGDPELEFEAQELVLTVPASFDEVARHLTIEAAKLAGYQNLTLLEEPQAAFYAWIGRHKSQWETQLSVGESVLVVDVGGGTTDFSLIEVTEGPGLRRMSVGRHLLLGGDNMDEALAHLLERKIGIKATSSQWHQIRHEARRAKELLLGGAESVPVVLQGTGSSLVSGSVSTSLERKETLDLLLGGFFGVHKLEEARKVRGAYGVRTVGLPYEEEPSITKQLALFLQKRPDWVLFNGGTMKPELFRKSIMDSLELWFGEPSKELESECLDLAVARGAASFGKARHGLGTKIEGGVPRAYYLGVMTGSKEQALTIVERGTDEGVEVKPDKRFMLQPNTPVAFNLYSSETRLNDVVGELVELDEEQIHRMPPLQTVLRFGKTKDAIPVHLRVKVTEIGTLELWLESATTDHKWQLEFQIRAASGQDDSLAQSEERQVDETFESGHLDAAADVLKETFEGSAKPGELMRSLEEILEQERLSWSPSQLRGLFDLLLPLAGMRMRSPIHEARFYNFAGFCLRPGFGCPLDDYRIKELWKVFLDKGRSGKLEPEIQRAICIRRIACGLVKGQQQQLFGELSKPNLRNDMLQREQLRAMASLEWVDHGPKRKLGQVLVERIRAGKGSEADLWSLARIGARRPLKGSVATVLPAKVVEPWIEKLLPLLSGDFDDFHFCLVQLSREVEVRELNVSSELRAAIGGEAPQCDQEQQEQVFGEALPAGLMLEV